MIGDSSLHHPLAVGLRHGIHTHVFTTSQHGGAAHHRLPPERNQLHGLPPGAGTPSSSGRPWRHPQLAQLVQRRVSQNGYLYERTLRVGISTTQSQATRPERSPWSRNEAFRNLTGCRSARLSSPLGATRPMCWTIALSTPQPLCRRHVPGYTLSQQHDTGHQTWSALCGDLKIEESSSPTCGQPLAADRVTDLNNSSQLKLSLGVTTDHNHHPPSVTIWSPFYGSGQRELTASVVVDE